jgi:DNA-binding response OmpR family regulator
MKILIVDDIEENLYMLKTILINNDFEVETAKNGIEALEKLKKDSIGLIISDVLMPKMDGFQLCREVKKDNKLKKIPFIFYTATYVEKSDEIFALSLGAIKYIIKPEDPDMLLKIIKKVIKENYKDADVPSKNIISNEKDYLTGYNKVIVKKLEKKVMDLDREVTRCKQVENNLNSRLRELNCLYSISDLVIDPAFSLEQIFKKIVSIVSSSWQYPEITCCRIVFNEKDFRTDNFKKTKWLMSEDIKIKEKKVGTIEVYYLKKKPEIYEGPF